MLTLKGTPLSRPAALLGTAVAGLLALSSAQAACSSPYNPVKEGLSRTYQTAVNGKTMSYTETVVKVTPSSYTYTNSIMPGASSTVKCTSKGIVNVASMSGTGMQVKEVRGVSYPPNLKVGSTWTSGVTMQGNVQGQSVRTVMDTTSKVVGREKVKVKAGTFDALKVQIVMHSTMTMNGKQQKQPTVTSTAWLAEGVGMVKTTAAGTNVELVEYTK
ncbi:TapB family protein [Deinococcus wulumuqiensis]|nr:hypothetical protein [Deinococcus wulumuqiensis]QII20756.1 DUF3108 domain-containing protein [Deinococcus wulumuqiensis R12]